MRRFLGATGRVLVTGGILLLLFVAYQLWGTGLLQARAQDDLRNQFEQELSSEDTPSTTTTTGPTPSTTTTTAPPAPPVPPDGDAVAIIDIPRIGVSQVVVEGVDVDDLRDGPGHYPATPLPGQVGNAAIAGHRTTYGAPFADLDQLVVGDEIVLRTLQGTFSYQVLREPFAVSPSAGEVLAPEPDPAQPGTDLATLTLTTCHPKYSAAERLIVQARLQLRPGAEPLPASPRTEGAPLEISGLDGDTSSRTPTVLWGLVVIAIGGVWWFLFHRYPRWYVWFAGVVPFLVVLWIFFTYLEQLLPANY